MVIFDNISYKQQEKLRQMLTERNIEFKKISEINSKDRLKSAVCVFSIVKCFYDIDAFEFLRTQLTFTQLNIILLESKLQSGKLMNGSIAIAWAHSLVGPKRKDYKVIAEIEDSEHDYMLEVINAQINPEQKKSIDKIEIYTDGSCSGNPGMGGWAAIIIGGGKIKEISGGVENTTNNRMELMAAIMALESIKKPCDIKLYSDSAYLINAYELGWMKQWKANRWKNSEKVLVKNIDLWQKLDSFTQIHNITFMKVKGHADDEFNNRCDKLAVSETKKLLKEKNS